MNPGPDSRAPSAADIIALLDLRPHPEEGGFYRETHRDALVLPGHALPEDRHGGTHRRASTAIYFLLTAETLSALHRVSSDEIFHHYAGDPVEQLRLFPDGRHEVVTIGSDLIAGQRPQVLVPAGVWQGARLHAGGRWALMGCTVAPGFEFEDYEHGERTALTASWPAAADMIAALTNQGPTHEVRDDSP